MNTDNMAISGETIDYGPCAFIDAYDPETVFSSIDTHGRYSYKNQPYTGAWNLSKLAETLLPLLNKNRAAAAEAAESVIADYWKHYRRHWLDGMRAKIGLFTKNPEDIGLISALLSIMEAHKLDYTNTFRSLSYAAANSFPISETSPLAPWVGRWRARISQNPSDTANRMLKRNPAVIPRNHRVEAALEAAENGDLTETNDLLNALSKPYADSEIYSSPPEPSFCGYKTFCGT
jgi:uncharacterized protein YdiU (UPF0061 family)